MKGNFKRTLRYLNLAVRNRDSATRFILQNGFGIEHLAETRSPQWNQHLVHSKDFLLKHIPADSESLLLLGAGRLFDIPIEELASKCKRIVLVDADPGVLKTWREIQKRYPNVQGQLLDLTGLLVPFSKCIRNSSLEEVGSFFQHSEPLVPKLDNFETIVSINLLSQLPLPFLELVERRFGEAAIDGELQTPLANGFERIFSTHLDLVFSASRRAIVICDAEYIWSDQRSSSLFGFDIEPTLERRNSLWNRKAIATWKWKITLEQTNRVEARLYERQAQ